MRFMMIMFPKVYENAKPGWVPDFKDKDMEAIGKYNEELQKAGVLLAIDGLTPPATMSARVTFKSGKSTVTDGPFTETKEVIGGYWIIQVKSREEALEWASRIPGKDNEMVEVRRMFEITDFDPEAERISKRSSATTSTSRWAASWASCKLSALPRFSASGRNRQSILRRSTRRGEAEHRCFET